MGQFLTGNLVLRDSVCTGCQWNAGMLPASAEWYELATEVAATRYSYDVGSQDSTLDEASSRHLAIDTAWTRLTRRGGLARRLAEMPMLACGIRR